MKSLQIIIVIVMAGAQDKVPQEPKMVNTRKWEWMAEGSDSLVDEMG